MGGALCLSWSHHDVMASCARVHQVASTQTRTSTRPQPLYLSPGQDSPPLPLSLQDARALLLPASVVNIHQVARFISLRKEKEIRKVCWSADEVSGVGDARVFYQKLFHMKGGHVLLQFLEIGAIVQVTKDLGGPMMFVCMRIDDEQIATWAHHAAQFPEDGTRTH